MVFVYWDNSKIYHGSLIAEIEMPDGSLISEADKIFEGKIGYNPEKATVGCQIRDGSKSCTNTERLQIHPNRI